AATCAGPNSVEAVKAVTPLAPAASSRPGTCAAMADVTKEVNAAKNASSRKARRSCRRMRCGADDVSGAGCSMFGAAPYGRCVLSEKEGMQLRLRGRAMQRCIAAQTKALARQPKCSAT